MLNFYSIYMSMIKMVLKLAGFRRFRVEIEPGTIINIWGPNPASSCCSNRTEPKRSVVFLHGFAAEGTFNWHMQALALAREYSVYIPDFLFFGGSITARADRSLEFQAQCMARALARLGVEKCALVGLSYGGMVSFKMAEMFPEMVEAVVVSSTVMAPTESVNSEALRRLGLSDKTWSDLLLPETVEGVKRMFDLCTYKLPNAPDWMFKHFLEVMFDNRKEKKELLEAGIVLDKDFSVPNFSQKFGLLWGEGDKIFNMENANNLKQQLGEKAIVFESIEKAGHIVQTEKSNEYTKHLKKILDSLFKDT